MPTNSTDTTTTHERTITEMNNEDATNNKIAIEDDQVCLECGSTEAGNCFYCKMD